MRIVSLLPSATEFICELGLRSSLVGVSHSCDYPAGVDALPTVTSTTIPKESTGLEIDRIVREQLQEEQPLYAVDSNLLGQLKPDLIITQGLCQVCAVTGQELGAAMRDQQLRTEVVSLEPHSLLDILKTWDEIGRATGCATLADQRRAAMQSRLDAVGERAEKRGDQELVVGLMEWLDPPFSPGHWNHELLRLVGVIDPFGQLGAASRTLTVDEVRAAKLDRIVIACCGMEMHAAQRELERLREEGRDDWIEMRRTTIVDGNAFFSRPGPRIAESAEILDAVLFPEEAWL